MLVEDRLRPLGVLAAADGSTPKLKKADPLLALRWRTRLVPAGAVQVLARAFRPLFWPPVIVVLLAALLGFDAWLALEHGVGGGLRAALYEPTLLLGLFAGIILATAFHEVGHATACRYGGARPGAMGAGVYLVWPAFYCDVTDAYRLDRRGRLRTDLGGVWFNCVFAVAVAGVFLATGYEPLVLLIVAQHLIVLQQLLPVLRFDGYYVLSDLTGVPDILGRVGPILRSLVPGREPDERVTALKPWVRRVVTTYVVLLVPVLLGMLLMMVLAAPRMFATAWDALGLQTDRVRDGSGGAAQTALGVVQVLALVLPCAAVALSAARIGRRAGGGVAGWASGSVPRTGVATVAAAGLAGLAVWTWWPNGDYEPLRAGERGTLREVASSIAAVPSGRPSFTGERAERYVEEPTERERRAPGRDARVPAREEDRQEGAVQEAEGTSTQEAPPTTPTTPAATTPDDTGTAPAATTPAEIQPAETVPAQPAPSTTPAATVTTPPQSTAP